MCSCYIYILPANMSLDFVYLSKKIGDQVSIYKIQANFYPMAINFLTHVTPAHLTIYLEDISIKRQKDAQQSGFFVSACLIYLAINLNSLH